MNTRSHQKIREDFNRLTTELTSEYPGKRERFGKAIHRIGEMGLSRPLDTGLIALLDTLVGDPHNLLKHSPSASGFYEPADGDVLRALEESQCTATGELVLRQAIAA